jgi:glycosyltransferase involved in cell wall biosynthesis
MITPFFSVVIPCFNGERTLPATLDTVVAQNFKDFEVVIVNNGSTDDSLRVMESYIGKLPLNIISQENAGVGGARNTGILNAKGKFVAFLDADDLWHESKLQKQYECIKNHAGKVDVICNYEYLQKDGVNLRVLKHGPYTDYFDLLLKGNVLSPSATSVRRELLNEVGLFSLDEKGHGAEDWDLWLKLARINARFLYLEEPLGVYILHGENFSALPEFHDRCNYVFESHVNGLANVTPEIRTKIDGARAVNSLTAMRSHLAKGQYAEGFRYAWRGVSAGILNSFFWHQILSKVNSRIIRASS